MYEPEAVAVPEQASKTQALPAACLTYDMTGTSNTPQSMQS